MKSTYKKDINEAMQLLGHITIEDKGVIGSNVAIAISYLKDALEEKAI